MGPIEKKITTILNNGGLSEETKLVLEFLNTDVKDLEKEIVNNSYHQGYLDKENGKSPMWNHYRDKYESYLCKIRITQTK
jgi:hypothetical protein